MTRPAGRTGTGTDDLALVGEFERVLAPGAVLRCVARCRRDLALQGLRGREELREAALALARDRLAARGGAGPRAVGVPVPAGQDDRGDRDDRGRGSRRERTDSRG